MRTLTKTGIRILSAKYRSILIKCAILNAMVLMFGASPSFAEDVNTWSGLKGAVEGSTEQINVTGNITRGASDEDIAISRTLSIVGTETGKYLSGADTYKGLTVGSGGNLTLQNITMQNFNNTSTNGGAISNSGTGIISNITGDFIANYAINEGGAIYNGSEVDLISSNFTSNNATMGGAISNNGNISNIIGGFESNYTSFLGGAISNRGNIGNIIGNFKSNSVSGWGMLMQSGGAIYNNNGRIDRVTGQFESNNAQVLGGAIYNTGTNAIMNILADSGELKFDGNYVTDESGNGGAIYNTGGATIGLYAKTTADSIKFTGVRPTTLTDGDPAYDIDGIYNEGNLNINGDGTIMPYAGTVNLYNVSDAATAKGTTNIYGGKVNVAKDLTQKAVTVASGATLTTNGNVKTTDGIANAGTLNLLGGKKEGSVITYAVIDSTVSGDGTTNFGNGTDLAYVQTNGAISQAVTIKQHTDVIANAEMGAEGKNIINYSGLTISADNVKGDIINGPDDSSSVLTLTEGTLSKQISGGANASTIIDSGKVTVQNTIQQARLSINDGATLETDANNLVDIGWFFNQGNLNLTGGTLSSEVSGNGTTNIESGIVNATDNITQNNINIKSGAELDSTGMIAVGTLTNNGDASVCGITGYILNNEGGSIIFNNITDTTKIENITLNNSGTVNFNRNLDFPDFSLVLTQNAGEMIFSTAAIEDTKQQTTSVVPINVFEMKGGSVNIADGSVNTLHIHQLNLTGNTNFAMDADLAAESMDKIQIHDFTTSTFEEGKVININKINLLSDATQDKINLSIFADDDTRDALKNNVRSNIKGLTYSSIYKYDALYNPETGMIGFTRYNSGTSDDFNPYIYAPSGVANTTAAMTTQIATLAMDKMDDAVYTQGRSGGDTPSSSNVWVRVMGLNDNVEFKNFENVDSKALTVVGGYNTDKITWADNSVVFGVYAGYIGGKQHYTANDIDQNGGYVGLSSALTLGDAFLTATVNGGLLKNKANNMYGSDRFNTLWLGTGLKAGYNYAITDSVVLQPNVYGGYTLVNTKDYTSVSGVKIATNNLNFFEIDPGLKLSAVIADGWTGSVQGKYAIVMDNGADITANDIALQNISPKNYFEYGIGIDKSVTDAFYLDAKINRHDGGRTGWNGSIEFRYKF